MIFDKDLELKEGGRHKCSIENDIENLHLYMQNCISLKTRKQISSMGKIFSFKFHNKYNFERFKRLAEFDIALKITTTYDRIQTSC